MRRQNRSTKGLTNLAKKKSVHDVNQRSRESEVENDREEYQAGQQAGEGLVQKVGIEMALELLKSFRPRRHKSDDYFSFPGSNGDYYM